MTDLEDYSGKFDPEIRYEDFSKSALIRLLKATTDMYLGIETIWRKVVEKRFGKEVAIELSREAWFGERRNGCYLESVLPRRAMKIEGTDVESWMKHLQVDPGLALIADIECELEDENTGILTVKRCEALDDMEKLGDPKLQEYVCHELEWKGFQAGVDCMNPDIKVEPLELPTLGCPRKIACQWKFVMKETDRCS